MKLLKGNDLQTFEQLCQLTQDGVKNTMSRYLKAKYKKVTETKNYIIAEGDIPIALVAHMDTVFKRPPIDIYYDRQKNVIWSPEGLGADDRAGVFAIIQIIRSGLRPHIILTTDEEKGAIGATTLVTNHCSCPFKDLRYAIQLDRRGADDCVFYECNNPDFTHYIEDFGFVENLGSFSDISVICPEWKIAGVNLSVGYYDEHSVSEILHVGQFLNTISKVTKMLKATDIPSFQYIPSPFSWHRFWETKNSANEELKCSGCNKKFSREELIETKEAGSANIVYYCIDCIGHKAELCRCCGEPYQLGGLGDEINMCEDCYYDENQF